MLTINEIFEKERTCNFFSSEKVSDEKLKQLYDIMKFGPTSGNSCPLRIVFAKSDDARNKVISTVMEGNAAKCKSAPVIAILAYDAKFYKELPKLFPIYPDFAKMFESNETMSHDTAFRNSSLQAGYFITIARALGLHVGPMSGFDEAKLNELFFAGTSLKVNFICNLGYLDESAQQYPRLPRLEFDEACKIL